MTKKLKPLGMVVGGIALVAVLFVIVLPKVVGGPLSIQVGGAAQPTTPSTGAVEAEPTKAVERRGIPVTLGERVVNLADPGGFRYLKIEVVLSLIGEDENAADLSAEKVIEEQTVLSEELAPLKPEIQDILTTVLTSKTVAEVSTADGKEAIKQELIAELAPLFHELEIIDIYFAQFLVQ